MNAPTKHIPQDIHSVEDDDIDKDGQEIDYS